MSVERPAAGDEQRQIEELIERSRAQHQVNPALARSYALEAVHRCNQAVKPDEETKKLCEYYRGRALLAEALSALAGSNFSSARESIKRAIEILLRHEDYAELFTAYECALRVSMAVSDKEDFAEYLAKAEGLRDRLPPELIDRKLAALNALWAMNFGRYQEAYEHLQRQEYLQRDHSDDYDNALLMSNLGVAHTRLGETGKGLEYHQRAVTLLGARRDLGSARVFGNMANTYFVLGDARALEWYFKSRDIMLECGNKEGAAKALMGISNAYEEFGQYEECLDALEKSRRLFEEIGDVAGLTLVLVNESNLHKNMGAQDKQLAVSQRAYELMRGSSNMRLEAYSRLSLAIAVADNQRHEDALESVSHALEILQRCRDHVNIVRALILRGEVLSRLDRDEEALTTLREACAVANGDETRRLYIDSLRTIADIYTKLERWRESAATLQEYTKELRAFHLRETSRRVENIRILQRAETARQEAEIQRLRSVELSNALERVSELNQRIREKNVDLERLDAEKNEFLGIAAHDLRSPLNNIRMLAQLISTDKQVELSSLPREYAQDILTVTDQMLALINKLLDVNKIESGQVDPQCRPLDWKGIVETVGRRYKEAAQKKNIEIVFEPAATPVIVNLDPACIDQVLDNLISNAVKYSNLGGQIVLRLEASEGQALFSVKDSGPGIVPEELPRLFERFQRLSTQPTAGENSVGLGLSIVHKLVELMDGRVWCESVEGQGATFFVQFAVV